MADKKALAYIQLYPDDLLASVYRAGDTPEILGARVLLWCISCDERPVGTLPDDDDRLAKWAGMTPERWAEMKARVVSNWRMNKCTNRWVIRRIVQQFARRKEVSTLRACAAAKRWAGSSGTRPSESTEATSGGTKADANAYAKAEQKQCLLTPSPSPAPSEEKKEKESPTDSCSSGDERAFEKAWKVSRKHGRTKAEARHLWGEFCQFWQAYPRRVGKQRAWEAWLKHAPPLGQTLESVAAKRATRQWQDQNYIPHPASFLNAGSWDDAEEQVRAMTAVERVAAKLVGGSNGDERASAVSNRLPSRGLPVCESFGGRG